MGESVDVHFRRCVDERYCVAYGVVVYKKG